MEIGTQSLGLTIDIRGFSTAIFPKALPTYTRMDPNMASPEDNTVFGTSYRTTEVEPIMKPSPNHPIFGPMYWANDPIVRK